MGCEYVLRLIAIDLKCCLALSHQSSGEVKSYFLVSQEVQKFCIAVLKGSSVRRVLLKCQ